MAAKVLILPPLGFMKQQTSQLEMKSDPVQKVAEAKRTASSKSNGQRDWNVDQFRIAFGEEDPEQNDLFDAVRLYRDVEPPAGCKDFETIIKTRSFDFANPPPPVEPIYKLAGHSMSTPGNLTVIMAHIKTGKAALIGAFLASSFGLTGNTLGVESANPNDCAVIRLDTEQPPTDHDVLGRVALSRVGLHEKPEVVKSICITGLDLQPKERFAFLEYLLEEARRKHGGIHSVLLDGSADFLKDVNNVEESFTAVDRLHKLAIQYETTIVIVIHFNPETEKTRGHFGSQLARKAETNLQLSKDKNDVTTVHTSSSRHAHIPKTHGPRFKWNDSEKRHVSLFAERPLKDLVSMIFTSKEEWERGLNWTVTTSRLREIENCSLGTARNRLDALVEEKLVKKLEKGNQVIYKPKSAFSNVNKKTV
jgi:hypothetical protein